MSVPGQPGQEPAPQDGQAPRGDDRPAVADSQPQPNGQEPEARTGPPERYDADYVKELRRSEAATRKRLAELEARVKADEDAKLSETERLKKAAAEADERANAAESKARNTAVRSALMLELGRQGAANPAVAIKLVDQAGLEIDDDGTVTGADKAVEALLKSEPYLKAPATNGSAGPPRTPKGDDGRVSEEEKRRQAVSIRQLW